MMIVSPLLDFWLWGSSYYPLIPPKFHEDSKIWPRDEKQKNKLPWNYFLVLPENPVCRKLRIQPKFDTF